jgi:DNA polymerase-1
VDGRVVLAIDGNSLVHRSYHAQARTGMHTVDGRPAWAVRGLLTQLVAAVDRIRPVAVVVGFDDPDRSERREQLPQYKAHRAEKLETLVEQLSYSIDVLRSIGIHVVVPDGLEADDVLASTAECARGCGATTVVVTSDRDAFALIDDVTTVLRIVNGGVEASPMMTAERLVMLLGVRPDQYRDYAALRGDPSDNLPGVRGIGPRTAALLLAEFGTAPAAFADPDRVRTKFGAGVANRLAEPEAFANWERNCRVMAMRRDVQVGLDLAAGPGLLPLDPDAVAAAFRAQQLTWTARQAVQVLADVDQPPPSPAAWPDNAAWPENWAVRTGPRLPKLPPRKPAMAQLSLF